MKALRFAISVAFLVLGVLAAPARAEQRSHNLSWSRIVGIADAGSIVGRRKSGDDCNIGVDCVQGTPAPWSAAAGRAFVDLDRGRVYFSVRGLVVASDPSFANLGTTTVVTMIRGTLVCNDTEPGIPDLVDTEAVPLSAEGDADFYGRVDLPASCAAEPNDIVFLIRIADVSDPDRGFPIDMWNAFGAVRTNDSSVASESGE
jgi:hypothetical protein